MQSIVEYLINDNKAKQEPITEFLVNKPVKGDSSQYIVYKVYHKYENTKRSTCFYMVYIKNTDIFDNLVCINKLDISSLSKQQCKKSINNTHFFMMPNYGSIAHLTLTDDEFKKIKKIESIQPEDFNNDYWDNKGWE